MTSAANLQHVLRTPEGDYITLNGDTYGAVKELQTIDPTLKVRLSGFRTGSPYFAVYQEIREGDKITHHLVRTFPGVVNSFGVVEGFGAAQLEEIRRINPENGYDYAYELQRREAKRAKERKRRNEETFGPIGEKAAWAVRKDLNNNQSRVFIRQGLPK